MAKKTQIIMIAMITALLAFAMTGCAGKPGSAAPGADQIANPWQYEVSSDDIQQMVNETFHVPDGAEDVVYGIMESQKLAEVQFEEDGISYCARMEPADEYTDISGLYYTWDVDTDDHVSDMDATYRRSINEDACIDNILFYDANKKMMYSISATAPDLDGFDLIAVAQEVFQ